MGKCIILGLFVVAWLGMRRLLDGVLGLKRLCLGKLLTFLISSVLVEEIVHEWKYQEETKPTSIDTVESPGEKGMDVVSGPPKLKSLSSHSNWTYVDSKSTLLRLTRALSEKGLREKELKTRLAEKMKELGYRYSFCS
jgi:hypothetical protein